MLRDWTTSEKIDKLSDKAELFFVRLIMKADDHGCFHAHPKLLKAALFPLKNYSEITIESCLDELAYLEIIQIYEHEGRRYLKIYDFGQRLRNMVSKFPQPDDNSPLFVSKPPPELEGKKNTNKNTKGADAQVLKLPFDSDEFRNTWNEWLSYKKERKQKFTKTTQEKQLCELGSVPEIEAIEMINKSIISGWTGLFKITKPNGKPKANTNSAEVIERKQPRSTSF